MGENQTIQDETLTALNDLTGEVKGLKDLFTRRLMNDRQKNELIQALSSMAAGACLEPLLFDLIDLMDRIEGEEGPVVRSILEELEEIVERYGVSPIETAQTFDPKLHKAVKAQEKVGITQVEIIALVRHGYQFHDRVMRPAEVIVARPMKAKVLKEEKPEEREDPTEK